MQLHLFSFTEASTQAWLFSASRWRISSSRASFFGIGQAGPFVLVILKYLYGLIQIDSIRLNPFRSPKPTLTYPLVD